MKPACAQAVASVLGREPKQSELDSIETRLHSSMVEIARKDPLAWRGMGTDARYRAAAKMASERTKGDIIRAQAVTFRDMELKARETRLVESFAPGVGKDQGQLKSLRQRTIFDAQNRGGSVSLEMERKAVFNDFVRQLDGVQGKGKFLGMVQDPLEQKTLVRAIFGEDTGKPEVNEVGATVRKVLELGRQRAEDAGITIHRLENWNLPQPMDWAKVGADRGQFVKDALERLDTSQYLTPEGGQMPIAEIRKLVEASAETLGTNGANKRAEGVGGYGSSVGANRNAPRQLHYRDANAYLEMMDKYGSSNNAHSLLMQHFNGLSRDISTAERYGRSAEKFFPQLVDRAFANDARAVQGKDSASRNASLQKLESLKRRTLKEWDSMQSPSHPGSLPLWATVTKNIRGIMSATLLGSSTLAAIPDLAMATTYGRHIGLAKAQILGNMAEGFKPSADNVKRISRLGIVVNGIQDAGHRMATDELTNHGVRFINHVVHVASLLRMWDRGMTHGVSASVMDMIGDHVSKGGYDTLVPADQKYMKSRGVTADHWETWRQAELDGGPTGGHTMLTPDAIYAIPDAKLQPIAQRRLGTKASPEDVAREIRTLRSDGAKQLLATALHEVQIGARGGSGESVADAVRLGVDAGTEGTLSGELLRWALFLKRTPLGIFKTHMIDVPGSMSDWRSAWFYRAKFMAASSILGAFSLALKNIVAGQDPEDLTTPKALGKILVASGGMGMYGDFLFGDKGDHTNGALTKVLGPGATAAEDVINFFHESTDQATGQSTLSQDQYGAKALQFARNYAAPFTRIWYLKAAFNHMVYDHALNALSPGYSERINQRLAQRNQSSWWGSGETMPERAPRLEATVGQ